MRVRYLYIVLLFVLFMKPDILSASMLFLKPPNTSAPNVLNYGFRRSANLFYFYADADLQHQTKFGQIGLFQKYSGDAGLDAQANNRDDEQASLFYRSPAWHGFELINLNNLILTSDNIRNTKNKYQRINTNLGVNYRLGAGSHIMVLTGIESNQQAQLESYGLLYGVNSAIKQTLYDNYQVKADFEYDVLNLFDGRNNSDLVFNGLLTGRFSANDRLNLNMDYQSHSRDFLSYMVSDKNNLLETRQESLFGVGIFSQLTFLKNMTATMNLSYNNSSISRVFNEYVEEYKYTGVQKTQSITNLNISGSMGLKVDDFSSAIDFKISSRDESNTIENKANLDKKNFDVIKTQENSLDNSILDVSFANRSSIDLTYRDKLSWNILYSINRYDTPEEINNHDKDESNVVAYLRYTRRFSRHLTFNLLTEYRDKHLVFLKAIRSAQNNHNRVLRFSPSLNISVGRLEYNPSIEVLANYTVYDFEAISPSVKSYSFRQLSYADSIKICIFEKLFVYNTNSFRYFTNGLLYWKDFSEMPQMENIEYENNIKLMVKRADRQYGFGIRSILQNRYDLTLARKECLYRHVSIGPEAEFQKRFKSGAVLKISGWYERQEVNSHVKWLPNLRCNCQMEL